MDYLGPAPASDPDLATKKYVDDTRGGLILLASVVAAGGETSLAVTGIPATHTHLKVITSLQGSANSSNCSARFNNDSAAGAYDRYRYYGGTASGQAANNADAINDLVNSSGTFSGANTGNFVKGEFDVAFYSRTDRYKDVTGLSHSQDGGSIGAGYIQMASGRWRNTAAINRVDIIIGSGAFNAGSIVEVWGL